MGNKWLRQKEWAKSFWICEKQCEKDCHPQKLKMFCCSQFHRSIIGVYVLEFGKFNKKRQTCARACIRTRTKHTQNKVFKVHVLIVPAFSSVVCLSKHTSFIYIVIVLFRFVSFENTSLTAVTQFIRTQASTSEYNIYYKNPNYIFNFEFILRRLWQDREKTPPPLGCTLAYQYK